MHTIYKIERSRSFSENFQGLRYETEHKDGVAEFAGSNPSTGAWEYQTHDILGSVRAKWNANKASVGEHEYTPYGNMYAYTGTAISNTDRGYTGHLRSNSADLYFAPYRFYSPQTARWMKLDPLGMIDGPNMYGYVKANPIMHLDPTGQGLISCLCLIRKIAKYKKSCEQELMELGDAKFMAKYKSGYLTTSMLVCQATKYDDENPGKNYLGEIIKECGLDIAY